MSTNPAQPLRRSARLAAQAHAMPSVHQAAPPSSLLSLSSPSDSPLSFPPTPALAIPSLDPKWDQLYELLSANEIPLQPGEFASSTPITRPRASSWYERHLAKCYQLRSIRVLDLPTALSSYARRTFDTIRLSTHDPPDEEFLMWLECMWDLREPESSPPAEAGVKAFYNVRAACWSALGSMKHLETGHWGVVPPVHWSSDASECTIGVADGVFRVRGVNVGGKLWNSMGNSERRNWQLLYDKAVKRTLASWEFKSLSVGSKPVMDEVQKLEGSFQWATCDECPSHPDLQSLAASSTLGPDVMWSSTATWLEECSSAFSDRDHLLNPELGSTMASTTPSASTRSPGSESESPNIRTARSMVQQIWAQAVSTDNTFMCLSSGNYEFIGIRHRCDQVLYLSPLIDRVSIGRYGWLQTGLYLAVIEDALARFSLRDSSSDVPFGGDPDSTDPGLMHSGQASGHSQSGGGNEGGTGYDHQPEDFGSTSVDMSTLDMISSACICLQYGVFNSVHPSRFIRYSHPAGTSPSKQLHVLVTLTSEISKGITGRVHGGILKVDSGHMDIMLPVVMKIAFGPDEVQQLEHEHHIYHLLHKACIPVLNVYGLFKEDYGDSNATGLILSYGGNSLQKFPKVTEEQSESFIEALQAIHNAGILHGDIHPRNLLVDDAGKTAIIDFAYSVTNAPLRKLNAELKQLSNLLLQLRSTSS